MSYLFIWLIYSRTDSWPFCQNNTARLSQGRPGQGRSCEPELSSGASVAKGRGLGVKPTQDPA